jgi:hypothetical protein
MENVNIFKNDEISKYIQDSNDIWLTNEHMMLGVLVHAYNPSNCEDDEEGLQS